MNKIIEQIMAGTNDETFIANRIQELGRNERKKILHEDALFQPVIGGFFDDQMLIYPGSTMNSFSVDDTTMYNLLIKAVRMLGGKYALVAVQYAMTEYFLNTLRPTAESIIERNEIFENTSRPAGRNYSIAELKDKAICAERAAVAHNLLQFIGAESYYVSGYLGEELNDGTKAREPHAFIIIKLSGQYSIYDPMNPTFYYDDEALTKCVDCDPYIIETGLDILPTRGTFSGDIVAKFMNNGEVCKVKKGERTFKIGVF